MEPLVTEHSLGEQVPQRSVGPTLATPSDVEVSTRTGMRTALDQKARIEHEELVSDVLRLRWLSLVGALAWLVFALQDWMVVSIGGKGRLSIYWGTRLAGLVPISLAFLRLRSPRGFTRKSFLALDIGIFSIVQAGISLMCLEYGGISSRYVIGVLVALIARASVLAAPWQRGLLIIGIPLGVYPLFMLATAVFSPQVSAQFANRSDLSIFVQNVFVSFVSGSLCIWGGHGAWAIRRQLFETRSIGKYRLKRNIGKGGMGEVWEAYHSGLQGNVALKILRPDQDANPEVVQRFEQEAAAMCRLTHPNTVRVFDYGVTEDGIWYYAMELLEGQTLHELVNSTKKLDVSRALYIAHQATRALAEAHSQGIIHRDVKPENIFVAQAGGESDFVKVLDFGIAKLSHEAANVTLTRTGAIFGTPTYMSPEAAGGRPMDARSDVYGMGAVLYCMIAGHPPFQGANPTELLMAHMNTPPKPLSALDGVTVPLEVDALVMRCLAKNPDDRFSDAGQLALAIEKLRN
jgi:eukaryotic-like serine/threonine-protein kinase